MQQSLYRLQLIVRAWLFLGFQIHVEQASKEFIIALVKAIIVESV
jgi:hypothetical protein